MKITYGAIAITFLFVLNALAVLTLIVLNILYDYAGLKVGLTLMGISLVVFGLWALFWFIDSMGSKVALTIGEKSEDSVI